MCSSSKIDRHRHLLFVYAVRSSVNKLVNTIFFAARCYASAAYMRSVSVCVSVTFIHSAKTNKHNIFKIFHHPVYIPHHSSFAVTTGMTIFRREPPLTGASNAGGVG